MDDALLATSTTLIGLISTVITLMFGRRQRIADANAKDAETIRAHTDAHIALEEYGDKSIQQILEIQRKQLEILSKQQMNTLTQLENLEAKRALQREQYETQYQAMQLEHRLATDKYETQYREIKTEHRMAIEKYETAQAEMRKIIFSLVDYNKEIVSGLKMLINQLSAAEITPAFILTEELEKAATCLEHPLLNQDILWNVDRNTRLKGQGIISPGDET